MLAGAGKSNDFRLDGVFADYGRPDPFALLVEVANRCRLIPVSRSRREANASAANFALVVDHAPPNDEVAVLRALGFVFQVVLSSSSRESRRSRT